ncbi:sulfurtransferase complex subunit TusC [Parendozoicomonas haliclonae]|uniref:Intracellular sulfur oxidation protein DsrF n=1 Tax=Parendozoicomonas haliclonae TaxID=1960125 RepID=A0A1X7ALL6_9GAMM|nr:sulfurtransferase complex subunit TusC [Parendozoicomonas haliclonae]SMA48980.1 Intracellular sulfur oxidation protein DsrF [Parendozoicomonas haliclonae]
MASLCILSSHTPYGSTLVRDGIETLLVAASYDLDTALVALGPGILQLLKEQAPDALPGKNTSSMLMALELYGVESVYVCQEDLHEYGLTCEDLLIETKAIARSELAGLLSSFDHVLNF